ncbi:MAG: hypothetical protein QOG76_5209 [Pseudonocardiales bacterium]|nr:hypothetical protein [Pseudonocardiales bacterium]
MVGAWADWADTVVADWPQDPRGARPAWEVFEGIAGTAHRHHTD